MARRPDSRSAEAQAYRRWYWTPQWRQTRTAQLMAEPLCRLCQAKGRIVPATVCDHIEPHKGDEARFWNGPFQSLCETCHNGTKQQVERIGYCTEVGLDGWPIDKAHPANR